MKDFDRLAIQHKDAVYRQLYRMCGNREDAEDILAESLLKAYRAVEDLSSENAFRSWLATIATRSCGRLKHRASLRPVLALAPLIDTPLEPGQPSDQFEQLAESEMKACIFAALNSLPKKYLDVYNARDIEGRTADETAKKFGITVAAAKSRLHRARAMIRERIDCDLVESY